MISLRPRWRCWGTKVCNLQILCSSSSQSDYQDLQYQSTVEKAFGALESQSDPEGSSLLNPTGNDSANTPDHLISAISASVPPNPVAKSTKTGPLSSLSLDYYGFSGQQLISYEQAPQVPDLWLNWLDRWAPRLALRSGHLKSDLTTVKPTHFFNAAKCHWSPQR
ncbi:hypothetical protein F0562_028289 [Nyssa sinensis]|uniref:Uncharacterized protein n=1 Tax=Nyssa sinensis TaxID=561372 RepID=A0A5J5BBS7_9ASTE|nr:hypothetical protein F0562_028289 [Nyssa sinensis]